MTWKSTTLDPNHEFKASYSFTIEYVVGTLGLASQQVTVAITDLHHEPEFDHTSPEVLADGTAVSVTTVLYQAVVIPDVAGDVVTSFTLEGDDAGLFNISADGKVTFAQEETPDFTAKSTYSFTVVAAVGT